MAPVLQPSRKTDCLNCACLGVLQSLANPTTDDKHFSGMSPRTPAPSPINIVPHQADLCSSSLPGPADSQEAESPDGSENKCFVPCPFLTSHPAPARELPSLLWLLNAKDTFLSQTTQSLNPAPSKVPECQTARLSVPSEPGPGSWRVFGGCIIS